MFQPVYGVMVWGVPLTVHGLCFALGASIVAIGLSRKPLPTLSFSRSLEFVLILFTLSLLGARLTFLLSYPQEWTSPGQLIAIWEGGLVSFGGLLTAALLGPWLAKKYSPEHFPLLIAKISYLTSFAWAIGRIGNFLQGESVGVDNHYLIATYNRVPIQLFEAVGCLVIAIYGYLTFRKSPEYSSFLPWRVAALYLGLRFVVDIWRDEAVIHGLHISQWAALAFAAILITTYACVRKKSPIRSYRSRADTV